MLYCKRPRQHRPKQRRLVSPGVCRLTVTSVNVLARRWCASDRCVLGSSLMLAVLYTTQDTTHDHRSRTRGANPALLPRREVACRHHRAPIACSPRNGSSGAGASWTSQDRWPATTFTDRRVPTVHPRDAEEVSVAHGQPSLCDGVRARLPGQSPPLLAFDLGTPSKA